MWRLLLVPLPRSERNDFLPFYLHFSSVSVCKLERLDVLLLLPFFLRHELTNFFFLLLLFGFFIPIQTSALFKLPQRSLARAPSVKQHAHVRVSSSSPSSPSSPFKQQKYKKQVNRKWSWNKKKKKTLGISSTLSYSLRPPPYERTRHNQ